MLNSKMVGYESTPYFSGISRQRGRGFGILAGTVARIAFPVIRNYFYLLLKELDVTLWNLPYHKLEEMLLEEHQRKRHSKDLL